MSEFERVVIREMMDFFQFSNVSEDYSGTITFHIQLEDDEEEIWSVRIHNKDPVEVIRGIFEDGDISCECTLAFDTFYGLYSNTLDPTSAVLSGKVQVKYWRYAQLSRIMGTFDFSSDKWDEFYQTTGKTPMTLADRDRINKMSSSGALTDAERLQKRFNRFFQLTEQITPDSIESILKILGIDDDFLSIVLDPPTPAQNPPPMSEGDATISSSSSSSSSPLSTSSSSLPSSPTDLSSRFALVTDHAKLALLPDSSPISPILGTHSSDDNDEENVLNENGLTPTQQRITDIYQQTVQMIRPLVKTITDTDPSSISTAMLSMMPTVQQVQQDLINQQREHSTHTQENGPSPQDLESNQRSVNQDNRHEKSTTISNSLSSSFASFVTNAATVKEHLSNLKIEFRNRMATKLLPYLPINTLHAMNYITSEHYLHYAAVWNSLGSDTPGVSSHEDLLPEKPTPVHLHLRQPPLTDPTPLALYPGLDGSPASLHHHSASPQSLQHGHHVPLGKTTTPVAGSSSLPFSSSGIPSDLLGTTPSSIPTLLDIPPIVEPVLEPSPTNALARFHQTRAQLAHQLKRLELQESLPRSLPSLDMVVAEDSVFLDDQQSSSSQSREDIDLDTDTNMDHSEMSQIKRRLLQMTRPPQVFQLQPPKFIPYFQQFFHPIGDDLTNINSSSQSPSLSRVHPHLSYDPSGHQPTANNPLHRTPDHSNPPLLSKSDGFQDKIQHRLDAMPRSERSQIIQEKLEERRSRAFPFVRKSSSPLPLEQQPHNASPSTGSPEPHTSSSQTPHARAAQPSQLLPFSTPDMDDLDADIINTFLKLMVQNIMNNPKRYSGEFNVLTTPTELTPTMVHELVDDFRQYKTSVEQNISIPFNTTRTPVKLPTKPQGTTATKTSHSEHPHGGSAKDDISTPVEPQTLSNSQDNQQPQQEEGEGEQQNPSEQGSSQAQPRTIHDLLFHNVSTLSIACTKERVVHRLRSAITQMHHDKQQQIKKKKKQSQDDDDDDDHDHDVTSTHKTSTPRTPETEKLLHELYASTKGYLWDKHAEKYYYYDDEVGTYYHVDDEDDEFILQQYYRHMDTNPTVPIGLPLPSRAHGDDDHPADLITIIEQSPEKKKYQYQYKKLPPVFAFFQHHYQRMKQLSNGNPSIFANSNAPSYHDESLHVSPNESLSPSSVELPISATEKPPPPSSGLGSEPLVQSDPPSSSSPSTSEPSSNSHRIPITLQHPIDLYLYTPVTSLSLLLNGSLQTPTMEHALSGAIRAYTQQQITPSPSPSLSLFTHDSDTSALDDPQDVMVASSPQTLTTPSSTHTSSSQTDLVNPIEYIHDFHVNMGYPMNSSIFIVAKYFSDHGVKIQLGHDFCLSDEDRDEINAYKQYRKKQLLLQEKQKQLELKRFSRYHNQLRNHHNWVKGLFSFGTDSSTSTSMPTDREDVDSRADPTLSSNPSSHQLNAHAHEPSRSEPSSRQGDIDSSTSNPSPESGDDEGYLSKIYNTVATPFTYISSLWGGDDDSVALEESLPSLPPPQQTQGNGDDDSDDEDEFNLDLSSIESSSDGASDGYRRYKVKSKNIFVHYNSLLSMLASDVHVIRQSVTKDTIQQKFKQIVGLYQDLFQSRFDQLQQTYDRKTEDLFNLPQSKDDPLDQNASGELAKRDIDAASKLDPDETISKTHPAQFPPHSPSQSHNGQSGIGNTRTSNSHPNSASSPSSFQAISSQHNSHHPPSDRVLSASISGPPASLKEVWSSSLPPQLTQGLSSTASPLATATNLSDYSVLTSYISHHLQNPPTISLPLLNSTLSAQYTSPQSNRMRSSLTPRSFYDNNTSISSPKSGFGLIHSSYRQLPNSRYESTSRHDPSNIADPIDLSSSDDIVDAISTRFLTASCEKHNIDIPFSLDRKRQIRREKQRQQLREYINHANTRSVSNKSNQFPSKTSLVATSGTLRNEPTIMRGITSESPSRKSYSRPSSLPETLPISDTAAEGALSANHTAIPY